MNKIEIQRDIRFDSLKAIGLLCIILAHIDPPGFVHQLRSFDVSLMVLISGAVFYISSKGRSINYWNYLKKRFVRLVLPTWIFLAFAYLVIYLASPSMGRVSDITIQRVVNSFLLRQDHKTFIISVWIIRIFVLVAISAPFFLWIYESLNSITRYCLLLAGIYAFHELLFHLYSGSKYQLVDYFFEEILFYLVPYSCILGLGMLLPQIGRRSIFCLSAVFGVIFSFIAFSKFLSVDSWGLLMTNRYKYPPRLYYVSYALFVSFALCFMFYKQRNGDTLLHRFIRFVASSSLEIYLWHFLILYFWTSFSYHLSTLFYHYSITFSVVVFFSVIVVYYQKLLLSKYVLLRS